MFVADVSQFSMHGLVALVVLLLLASAVLSAMEISMMASNRYRLRHLAEQKNHLARLALRLLQSPERLLSVLLLTNTFVNILMSILMGLLMQRIFGPGALGLTTILTTLVVVIFAEIVPKTIASSAPERLVLILARPLQVLMILLSPFVFTINGLVLFCLRKMGLPVTQKQEPFNQEELRTVIGELGGPIQLKDKRMLLGVLDLQQLKVNDLMIPKQDVVGLDIRQPVSSWLEKAMSMPQLLFPVYENHLQNLLGLAHVRDVVRLSLQGELTATRLKAVLLKPYFIPENTRLTQLLIHFQASSQPRIAFVLDEYGEIIGFISVLQILEAIVGGWASEVAHADLWVQSQDDGSFLVSGSAVVRDLVREFAWDLPTDGPKTISGLIVEYLEFIPETPLGVLIHGYLIETVDIEHHVIHRVRIYPPRQPSTSDA